MRTLLAVVIFSIVFLSASYGAWAACLSITMQALNDKPGSSRNAFKPNDMVVLCIRLDKPAYVSVWDAPEKGDRERIFPNAVTNPPSGARAAWLEGGHEHCFGKPGSFPLYMPPEDGRSGKITVLASQNLDAHLSDDDVRIPGRATPTKFNLVTRAYRPAADCAANTFETFDYQVSK